MTEENKYQSDQNRNEKMQSFINDIDTQILMLDDRQEILMYACAMLATTRRIFDTHLGVDGRKEMFRGLI